MIERELLGRNGAQAVVLLVVWSRGGDEKWKRLRDVGEEGTWTEKNTERAKRVYSLAA